MGCAVDLAQRLIAARRAGALLAGEAPRLTLVEGYRVQAVVTAALGVAVGWKIGATSARAMAVLGIDEPVRGRVYAVTESGAVFAAAGDRPVEVEPEIIVSGDGGRAWLGLEIVRPSRDDAPELGGGFVVADNAAHVGLVRGPEIDVGVLADQAAVRVTLALDRAAVGAGDAADVAGGPLGALAWLARAVAVAADAPVATGALTRAVRAPAGGTVTADFGALGRVTVRIAG